MASCEPRIPTGWACCGMLDCQSQRATVPEREGSGHGEQLPNEAIKALGHIALSDSFAVFASQAQVKALQISSAQDGVDRGVQYNGSAYSAALHKAATSLNSLLGAQGLALESALAALEFGREVLGSEYSKLSKMMSVGKTLVEVDGRWSTPVAAVAWLVRFGSRASRSDGTAMDLERSGSWRLLSSRVA